MITIRHLLPLIKKNNSFLRPDWIIKDQNGVVYETSIPIIDCEVTKILPIDESTIYIEILV